MMITSAVTEKDDNLIDLNAYSESANEYAQDIAVDGTRTYYAYDISYIVCYNKWGSNIGTGNNSDRRNSHIKTRYYQCKSKYREK